MLACWAAVSLAVPEATRAVVNDVRAPSGNCRLTSYNSFALEVNLSVVGVPVANASVKVEGTDARIFARRTTGSRACDTLVFQIPAFQWTVAAPPGQTAGIANGGTLSPTINLAGAGGYRARLTACPAGCRLSLGGASKTVGPFVRELAFDVAAAAPPPPETVVTPPSPIQDPSGQASIPSFGFATRTAKCGGLGGGFTKAEWVPTQRFGGAGDYRLVEGPVETWSRVADLDNFLNHSSEDFEWKVTPDAPYRGLAQGEDSTRLKSEWERGSLPDQFQPTPGRVDHAPDRISTYGFWIIDCGHPNHLNTEMHPPVGLAVQRPRPVQIPQSFRAAGFPNGFGSNVWVPGVVADIWFNRNSGASGSCFLQTSLHQPVPRLPFPLDCLGNPHPLNRKFTFNVYLPKSPQQQARDLGRNAPPVPLFIGTQKLSRGTGGPEPRVDQLSDGNGVTFLRVTVDLSTFSDSTYARRLSVAWAYPSPDNWGASRWRVTLNSLKVTDDSEPFPFDDGDWRLYLNTNNVNQEWTELFSCDGCIEEKTYTLNVSTGRFGGTGGNPTRSRNLGPDPIVFPGQPILVHATGYDDEVLGDDVGSVTEARPQQSLPYDDPASHYRLRYSISPVGSVGPASLTPEANALLNAYAGGGAQCASGPLTLRQRVASVCEPSGQNSAFSSKRVSKLENLPAFENEGEEGPGQALMDITPASLRRDFNSLNAKDRRQVLSEIRRELQNVPSGLRGDYNELAVTLDRALPDTVADSALPPTLRRSITRYQQQARRSAAARRASTGGIARLTLGELPAPR
jgi:hypothetical protein